MAMQRYALLLCAWATAVSAISPLALGTANALASSTNNILLAGQALGQVGPWHRKAIMSRSATQSCKHAGMHGGVLLLVRAVKVSASWGPAQRAELC